MRRVSYAEPASCFGDLRLPDGDGPFPVVLLIHGGCWLADYDLGYISGLAAAITAEGYATWSIEYRRVGEEGGGWPGTFEDVAAAADHLRVLAETYPLDLDHVVAAGTPPAATWPCGSGPGRFYHPTIHCGGPIPWNSWESSASRVSPTWRPTTLPRAADPSCRVCWAGNRANTRTG